MAWWYEKGGVATGPIAHEDLHNMILSEELTADTLVWCSGMGEWWAYTSLVSEFGPDVLEWCATNMTEFPNSSPKCDTLQFKRPASFLQKPWLAA